MKFDFKQRLEQGARIGQALSLLEKNEVWVREQTAHAFADLLLFSSSRGLHIKEVPEWTILAGWLDYTTDIIRVLTPNMSVPFEELLDACAKDTASMIELQPKKLILQWRKQIKVPFTEIKLQVEFDLEADIPEEYRGALKAAGSLRDVLEPSRLRETIQCNVGDNDAIPF